ncbi:tripartite tricarboxylate transporter substrate-binding protein [Breoghania sp.]|uniref:Bug family tripartite tricarboxylate transporter substrate binding protein n=1 Tax=Breoghania sp. TaxID=2065378 RepID=UPI00262B2D05|nr:tripartite tricarboxylate transporter substrate-binding protein [Breoghania sp.]MDJ0930547.1 tripartite tricarboxylate transporter substrate-binding protein [Breoghania sp.]
MNVKSSLVALAFTASSLALLAAPSQAAFPEKPVEMIVPYGAGGQIDFSAIAAAKPDGYMIGWINSGILTSSIVRPDVTFNIDTYDYVANIVIDPGVLSVAGDSDINSLEDLIALAKKEKITVSHEGIGGGDHLAVLQFEHAADVAFDLVAFNGDAEAKAALLGGHIGTIEGNVSEEVGSFRTVS